VPNWFNFMTEDSSFSHPANILAASGHIGYSWDLVKDEIIWCGAWQEIIGGETIAAPTNAAGFAARVLANDHHLIFNGTEAAFDRTYRLLGSNGELVTVQEHGTTHFEKGHAVRQQGILRRTQSEAGQHAPNFTSPDRDPLTGRPNRMCFLALIEKIMNGPLDVRKKSAYMIVGIDKLAFMNEAMGPKIVDQFLCAVADRLNELCPTRCIIGRVSSDTFGILMPGMENEVEDLALRIIDNFHSLAITAEPLSLHVPVSIGSYAFENRRADAQTVMILTEQALREARDSESNRYVIYCESPSRSQQNRTILEIGELVKSALKNDKIKLAFQPVVDAKTGEIMFYEVLSRLYKNNGQLIPACDFIPVVEQLGLAPDFDRHILSKSLEEMEGCETLKLAVNISGLTSALPDWPCYVESKLSSRPHVASRLIIEITENAAVLNIAKIKNLVETLRKMGSKVALDDFGAGATSVRHLRDLSLAIMKIDRDLLNNIMQSPEQQHLVRMLTNMAHGLGIQTVAEGIESEEVAVWLRDENIDMLQGFYLGRPSFERPWLDNKTDATPTMTTVSYETEGDGLSPCY